MLGCVEVLKTATENVDPEEDPQQWMFIARQRICDIIYGGPAQYLTAKQSHRQRLRGRRVDRRHQRLRERTQHSSGRWGSDFGHLALPDLSSSEVFGQQVDDLRRPHAWTFRKVGPRPT